MTTLDDWIAALRHPTKYTQTRGVLRRSFSCFCALGVLCDTVDADAWEIEPGGSFSWHGAPNGIPTDPTPDGVDESLIQLAVGMNETGSTFAEIADALEAAG